MSRSRLNSSAGLGQLLTLRAGPLLLLAALVAVAAIFYGNAYASHGHAEEDGRHAEAEETQHADDEDSGGEAVEEDEEHAEEEGAKEGSRSLKLAGSILIATAGAGLVPFGLLLARRRTRDALPALREEEAPAAGPAEAPRVRGIEPVLRPALALLSTGAAVIHFVVIPAHWDEYWGQGLFFIVAAIAQILWTVWIVIAPTRLLYLAGAAGNAFIAALWVVTRTAGIPAGPGAGEREAVEFADTLATVFEILLVVGALALARAAPARSLLWPRGALDASASLAIVVAGLTAASLLSLVEL
jgi:hypothetical protein